MFEIAYLRQEFRGRGAAVILPVLAVILALILLVFSFRLDAEKDALMGKLGDCSWVHTLPIPELCKDRERIDKYQDLGNKSKIAFAGCCVLIGGLLLIPILRRYRKS